METVISANLFCSSGTSIKIQKQFFVPICQADRWLEYSAKPKLNPIKVECTLGQTVTLHLVTAFEEYFFFLSSQRPEPRSPLSGCSWKRTPDWRVSASVLQAQAIAGCAVQILLFWNLAKKG